MLRIRQAPVIPAVMAALAAWSLVVAAGGLLGPGVFSAVVFAAFFLVSLRVRRLASRPVPGNAAALERLSGLALPLSRRAGLPCPRLAVGARTALAGVRNTRGGPVLTVGGAVLDALDDAEVAAIVAHELAHVRHRDVAVYRRRTLIGILATGFATGAGVAIILQALGIDPLRAYPFMLAVYLVAAVLVLRTLALWQRPREARADRDGALLTGDPASLASALEKVEALGRALRAQVRGGPPLSWLIAPLIAPAPSHPKLAARRAALLAMTRAIPPPPPPPPPPPAAG